MVEKAREKISNENAKVLILARWKETLRATVLDYVYRYERAFVGCVERLYVKYEKTLYSCIQNRQNSETRLNKSLMELGYDICKK